MEFEKQYKNKRVVVTGGAGFIGSHIAERLVKLGANVVILDDLSTGTIENIVSIQDKITFIKGDIRSKKTCLEATKNAHIIFHLAAFVSVPESFAKRNLCTQINVGGTRTLLEAANKNNVTRFVFSSSSAVYGERSTPCTEQDSLAPQSPYAESKVAGEQLCQHYSAKTNVNCTILRYFNVYGKRQDARGPYAAVVTLFTHNLLTEQPITIFGNGLQTRDFIHVDEVVKANLTTGIKNNIKGEIFNIASGKSITLLDLLKQLEKQTGKRLTTLQFKPARKGEIKISLADCSKYHSLIADDLKIPPI